MLDKMYHPHEISPCSWHVFHGVELLARKCGERRVNAWPMRVTISRPRHLGPSTPSLHAQNLSSTLLTTTCLPVGEFLRASSLNLRRTCLRCDLWIPLHATYHLLAPIRQRAHSLPSPIPRLPERHRWKTTRRTTKKTMTHSHSSRQMAPTRTTQTRPLQFRDRYSLRDRKHICLCILPARCSHPSTTDHRRLYLHLPH